MEVVKPVAAGLLAPVTGGASLMLLNKTPKVQSPSPPPVQKAPATDTQAVQAASADAAARRNRSQGFRSTILSKLSSSPLKETIGA